MNSNNIITENDNERNEIEKLFSNISITSLNNNLTIIIILYQILI